MGILHLNTFINQQCGEHIQTYSLSILKKKKIVIDMQTYLYLFLCENGTLMENVYLMCTLFVKYEIIPLFVFDGRKTTVVNKTNKRIQRKENRSKIINNVLLNPDKIISESKFRVLKRQVVRVTTAQIKQIQDLIKSFGFTYLDATGEADEICAHSTITNKTHSCVSEDTDMFAYGCMKIYRNLNLTNQTISLVNVKGVLKKLNMSPEELRQVCVLANNDYNCSQENVPSIYFVIEQFQKYKTQNCSQPFYQWFIINNNCKDDEEKRFERIYNIYDIFAKSTPLPTISFHNGPVQYKQLQTTMESDGFYYI